MKTIILSILCLSLLACVSTRTGNPVKASGDFADLKSSSSFSIVTSTSTGKGTKDCGPPANDGCAPLTPRKVLGLTEPL